MSDKMEDLIVKVYSVGLISLVVIATISLISAGYLAGELFHNVIK